MSEPSDGSFEQLLQYLQQGRGFDFTGYKSPSLKRRIAKRMQFVNIERFADYIDYLEVHPEEFSVLFNTILINVTAFFRDEEAWKYLAETIVPRILSYKQQNEPIRIWSAGCASGEEAYSIAMVMAEALGRLDFRHRVKIYASDVDEEALIRHLRSGHVGFACLDVTAVEPLPPECPLWDLPNVLISPHSASTVTTENNKITEIFCHNLRCFLDGRTNDMKNILDKQLMY